MQIKPNSGQVRLASGARAGSRRGGKAGDGLQTLTSGLRAPSWPLRLEMGEEER